MEKFKNVFLETLPILFGVFLSYLFWQYTALLFFIYLAITFSLIHFHGDKDEYIIFFYGIVVGTIVEIVGTKVGRYQSFTKSDFFGIPIWLPVAWGYGFVAMKRVAIILKNK